MPRPFPPEKRAEWAERLRRQKESGRGVVKWCQENEVSYHQFTYWKGRLAPTPSMLKQSAFSELPGRPEKTGIAIECPGVRIELAQNFDLKALKQCLRMLKGLAC